MTTGELIPILAKKCNLSEEGADGMIKAVTDSLVNCFKEIDSVAIPGFGTFVAEKKDEYISEADSDGKRYLMPPSISISFKTSVVLRKKITG